MAGLKPAHWNHQAMEILSKSLKKERLWQSLCAAGLLLLSAVFMVKLLPHWFSIVLLVPLFLSTYWLIELGPWRHIRQHPFLKRLEKNPESVVWVYGLVNQISPYGFLFIRQGILYFNLEDGQEISVIIPDHQLKLVSRFLNRVLPHATFGHSPERELMFKENPKALRKEE